MSDRMLFNLYALPILLIVGACGVLLLFGIYIPNVLQESPFFKYMVPGIAAVAEKSSLALLALSLLSAAYQTHRLYKWQKGNEPSCKRCGGLLSEVRDGRYGPYCKCLSCGKNESV